MGTDRGEHMGRVIAVANQKGGVGKTTTAVNLAACLAAADRKVLLIDLDPQGNATQAVGVEKNALEHTVYDAIMGDAELGDVVLPTKVKNLDVAPTNRELVGAEVELVNSPDRQMRLQKVLESVRDKYDFILVDCPPALGLLTLNGLVAANGVLVPQQCEYLALEGLSELLQTIIFVRDNYNPALAVQGVLLTMYQHTNLSKQVVEDVRGHLGTKVYETVIPRNVTLSEAPSFGKPVIYYDIKCTGAQAYIALAREVISRGA